MRNENKSMAIIYMELCVPHLKNHEAYKLYLVLLFPFIIFKKS